MASQSSKSSHSEISTRINYRPMYTSLQLPIWAILYPVHVEYNNRAIIASAALNLVITYNRLSDLRRILYDDDHNDSQMSQNFNFIKFYMDVHRG